MNSVPGKKERGQRLLGSLQSRRQQAKDATQTRRNERVVGMSEDTYNELLKYAQDLTRALGMNTSGFYTRVDQQASNRAFDVIYKVEMPNSYVSRMGLFYKLSRDLQRRENLTTCYEYFMRCKQLDIKLRLMQ